MSIIGTRPPLISETNFYELHHRARLAIKPGITGMWQVSGRSDITDFEEVVRLDKEYITNWNIGLDIKILFKTVMVVLRSKMLCGQQEIELFIIKNAPARVNYPEALGLRHLAFKVESIDDTVKELNKWYWQLNGSDVGERI